LTVGWVKLHRKLLNWEWYTDANVYRVFTHLLMTVNYEPSSYRGHEILAGSCVTGRIKLSKDLCLSEQAIRTALVKLKSTNEITIKSTNEFSIISITNWQSYQDDQPAKQHSINQRTTNEQPHLKKVRSKEGKKIKKDSPCGLSCPADVSDKIWSDHLAIRQEKNLPITQTALDRMRAEADKSGITLEDALKEACERGWASYKAGWLAKPEMRSFNNLRRQDQMLIQAREMMENDEPF